MTRKKIVIFTIVLWSCITSVYAYFYVRAKLSLPDLVGYEAEWDWQLAFFLITKLPIFLVFLFLVLFAEYYFTKPNRKTSD
jgi:hypothetical protein